jgi:putative transposase
VGVPDASTSPPKERYTVSKDNIIKLIQPANVEDALTEILRNGTRALLAQAVEAEVSEPVREHLESAESVVIQCRRLDS